MRWMLGHDQTHEDELLPAGVGQGAHRYWKFCTDHKVVGIQYLVAVIALFGVGGTLAMMIRTQLITAHSSFLGANAYNAIVSVHGMAMIVATIIMVTGPFGNFIVPIMIGAKDMAFPRLNALSFWLLFAAVPPLLATFFLGGVDAGWTTYAPLSVQAPAAMDAFAYDHLVFAISVTVVGHQHHRDRAHHAGQGHDAQPPAHFHLGRRDRQRAGPLRHARLHRRHGHDVHRPGHRHLVLRGGGGGHAAGCGRTSSGSWATPRCT